MAQNGQSPHEQAGLEVVPEPEAPQVVEKPYHEQINTPFSHTPVSQATVGGYTYPVPSSSYYAQSGYLDSRPRWGGNSSKDTPTDRRLKKKILGLPRRRFWWAFGLLLAILVIGIAVGLGIGLGTRKSSSR
jgi:hypothetical protein